MRNNAIRFFGGFFLGMLSCFSAQVAGADENSAESKSYLSQEEKQLLYASATSETEKKNVQALAYSIAGRICEARGDLTGAIQLYQLAVDLKPINQDYCKSLASVKKKAEVDMSILALARDHAKAPGGPVSGTEAYLEGQKLEEQRRLGDAIASFQMAVRAQPSEPKYISAMGSAYYLAQDFKRATLWYQQAVDLEPGNKVYKQGLKMSEDAAFNEKHKK